MKQTVLGFGAIILCVLILVEIARLTHFRSAIGLELWIAVFSVLFLLIGFYLSRKLRSAPSKPEASNEPEQVPDEKVLAKLNISRRELEVLQLISDGLSNQQIGDRLFVSGNTIKKHISSLFLKMDVERRTEAVRKAKDLKIIR